MKVFKFMVDYRTTQPGAKKQCQFCSMFRNPNHCTLVIGDISRFAVCDRWESKESKS